MSYFKLNYIQIFGSQLQEYTVHIHNQYWSSNAVEGNDLQFVNYMKHMTAVWEDGKFIITTDDAYSYHWVLNGWSLEMVIENKTPATFIKGIPLWNIKQYRSSA